MSSEPEIELEPRKTSAKQTSKRSSKDVVQGKKMKMGSTASGTDGRTLRNEKPVVNPFACDEKITHPIEFAKLTLGIVLVPLRLIIILSAMAVASVAMSLTTKGKDASKPLSKSTHKAQARILEALYGVCLFCLGIYNLKVKGKRADSSKCKMLVLASHSTVLDAVVCGYVFGGASAVAKGELKSSPMGRIFKATQTIFVERDDKNSKANVAQQIQERVSLDSPWQRQLGIAPEGTCTNRKSLIQFKVGAFSPGAPVQPVLLHWTCDTFDPSWTAGAHNRLLIFLRCLAQPYQAVTIEFLPIYEPNEEEKKSATLFANNVRDVMAKKLKVPVSDHSYSDMFLAKVAAKCKLPVDEVLNFSFATLKDEVRHTKIERDQLFDVCSSLLRAYSKGSSHTGLLSRKKYEKRVASRCTKAVGLDQPLDWSSAFGQDVEKVDFFSFLVAHVNAMSRRT